MYGGERIPGRSVEDLVREGWRPDAAEIVRIATFLLEVVRLHHSQTPPDLHLDIRPANVKRSDDGQVRLVGYGLPRDPQAAIANGGYMPPELFHSAGSIASDLYGIAATVLFLASGKSPSEFPSKAGAIAFRGKVRVSAPLAAWIERGLEPKPEDRFAGALAMLQALRARKVGASRRPRSSALTFALLGVLGVLTVGTGTLLAVDAVRARTIARSPLGKVPIAPLPARHNLPNSPLHFAGGVATTSTLYWGLDISPDDRVIAVGAQPHEVTTYDLTTGTKLHTMVGQASSSNHLGSVQFTRDGRRLFTAAGKNIVIWDAASGAIQSQIELPEDAYCETLSPDEKTVFESGASGAIREYDIASHSLIRTMQHGTAAIVTLRLSPDGKWLASSGTDGALMIWSVGDGKLVKKLAAHMRPVDDVAFTPDGKTMITAGEDHVANIWSIRGDDFLGVDALPGEDELWRVSMNPAGTLAVLSAKEGRLRTYDFAHHKGSRWGTTRSKRAFDTRFTHDGRALVVASATHVDRYAVSVRGTGTHAPIPDADAQGLPKPRDLDEALYQQGTLDLLDAPVVPIEIPRAKVKKMGPQSALGNILRARVLMREAYRNDEGADPKLIADAQLALDEVPANKRGVEWYATTSRLARERKDLARAREALKQALLLDPNDTYALLVEAGMYEAESNWTLAVRDYVRVAKRTTERVFRTYCYYRLETAYENMGDIDGATSAFEAQIALRPENPWAHFNFAFLLMQNGDAPRAVEEAKRTIAISDFRAAHNYLSDAYLMIGDDLLWNDHDPVRALAQYELAVAASPKYPDALYGRAAARRYSAVVNHDRASLELARADLKAVLAIEKDERDAQDALAALDRIQ